MKSEFDDNKGKGESIREKITNFITLSPGIRYRELLRLTNVSNGVLSYHLNSLSYSGKIKVNRFNNRVTRYYSNSISESELDLLGFLRQSTSRDIILFIAKNNKCTFNDILIYIKKVPSTVSWHLNRLKESGIIIVKKKDTVNTYLLAIDPQLLQELLARYKITSV
ncbi:MAG: winged helix-turn-helix transcriptional regulator, partial [Nitrososphaeraceae archaeon]